VPDRTQREIIRTLFLGPEEGAPARDPRTDVLVAMVLDLVMEVEALRAAQLASNSGSHGPDSAYARAYRDTAYLTHNASGPSFGVEKLLSRFYPAEAEEDAVLPRRRRTWRECLMLLRLGLSREQIHAYQEDARRAETFS